MADQPKVSPYNFVPLGKPPQRGAYPGIDRLPADLYSGMLACELEVVTALFTADHRTAKKPESDEKAEPGQEAAPDQEEECKLLHFLRDSHPPDGRPILQGTSLRGMVRSIYEAATNSCLPLAAVSAPTKKASRGYDYDDLGEHQACTSPGQLCPACSLFGIIHGEDLHVQGRVTFSDAVMCEGNLRKGRIGLAELSSPKPHHSGIYGAHGRSGRPIAGRKLYYHHEAVYDETPARRDRSSDVAEHAPTGTKFKFTVSFRNLSIEELAKLRHCLVLDEGLAHKMGMAKPLGFGSCEISLIDAECVVYQSGGRYTRWRAPSMKLADLDLGDGPFPENLREILRIDKHQGQQVGYLSWRGYKSARIDQDGQYCFDQQAPPRRLPEVSKGSGFNSLSAAMAQASDQKADEKRPKIRVGQKIKAEVTAEENGEYVLRVKDSGQEGVRLRPGTRWKVGQTVKVRVVSLDSEGRISKVAP